MMGPRQEAQTALFYYFSIEAHVPSDHVLRAIAGVIDLSSVRAHLTEFYSSTGRPSVDPELMMRMLLVGYVMGIRSERRLCEEVHLNLAYRWFCKLDLTDPIPDHSTFSKNRHGRFRDSDLLRYVFETVVAQCIKSGLASGQRYAVDASIIAADANRQKSTPKADWNPETIDPSEANEPMIADPDVNNIDVSRRYTHDTIRPISYYKAEKNVDLGFVGSCMVHKGDMKILSHMLQNLEKQHGKVEFKAPLVVAPPTYNIVDELKEEGDWDVLKKYAGFEFDDDNPKNNARTEYENILYLERPGCNLCMGNQEKAGKGDTVMATSTRLFQGRVVEDSEEKKGESLLASTPVVVLSTILGRTPTLDEYKQAVDGIDLTKFAPPTTTLVR